MSTPDDPDGTTDEETRSLDADVARVASIEASIGYALSIQDTVTLTRGDDGDVLRTTAQSKEGSSQTEDRFEKDELNQWVSVILLAVDGWDKEYGSDSPVLDGWSWSLVVKGTDGTVMSETRGANATPGPWKFALLISAITHVAPDFGRLVDEAWPEGNPTPDDYDGLLDAILGGGLSLMIGESYYSEGMASTGTHRVECFEEARDWYSKAAEEDNAQALVDLGYVYSYGRCGKVDDEKAFDCFNKAASQRIPEACYKLGDLYAQGRGCTRSASRAFELYVTAHVLAHDEDDPAVWGSTADRLAGCLERGEGCDVDLARARDLYLEAEQGFDEAVQDGQDWYEKRLRECREASARLAEA